MKKTFRTFLRPRWLLLTPFALIPGCPARPDLDDCDHVCTALVACGYLPSSLGQGESLSAAKDDCTARCERSDETVRTLIVDCLQKNPVKSGNSCGSQQCVDFGGCVLDTYPKARPLGEAAIRIESDIQSSLSGAGAPAVAEQEANALCGDAGLTQGNWFVDVGLERRNAAEITCTELFTQPTRILNLPPTVVTPGLRVRWTVPPGVGEGGGSGVEFCREFVATPVPLCSDTEGSSTVIVPIDLDGGRAYLDGGRACPEVSPPSGAGAPGM